MASSVPTLTLNDGVKMPVVGLGAWMGTINPQPSEIEAFKTAINTGYRHIDTAAMYNTEEMVGLAIAEKLRDGTVKREDLFITTKLLGTAMQPDRVVPALRSSLKKLQLDYVDNYIIHWPVALTPDSQWIPGKVKFDNDVNFVDTWKSMEECKRLGLARSIGVSNFNRRQLQMVLDSCSIKPSNNQIEVHPFFQNQKLVAFCKQNDIAVVCFCPLARPGSFPEADVASDPTLSAMAKKYGYSNQQVALRFLVQEGLVVIPKSANPERQKANLTLFSFEISEEDLVKLRKLDRNLRVNSCKEIIGEAREFPFNEEY